MGIHIMPPFYMAVIPKLYTVTFYPDADPEVTSVDGETEEQLGYGVGLPWLALLDASGIFANDNAASITQFSTFRDAGQADAWRDFFRANFLFDTSPIPANAKILSASLIITGHSKLDTLGIGPNVSLKLYSANPTSNTALVAGDYVKTKYGTTPFCDNSFNYSQWNIAPSDPYTGGENEFVFNTTGIAAIGKGIGAMTKLSVRCSYYDVARNIPPWQAGAISMASWSADAPNWAPYPPITVKPRLVVTYSL